MSRESPKTLPRVRVPPHPYAMRASLTFSACCVAIAAVSPSRIGSHTRMACNLGEGNLLRTRPTAACPDWQPGQVGERSATTRTFSLEATQPWAVDSRAFLVLRSSLATQSGEHRRIGAHLFRFQHSRFDCCSGQNQLCYDFDLTAMITRRWVAPSMDRPAQR